MKSTNRKHTLERYLFKGLPASGGVGIGLIYILKQENYKLNRDHIIDSDIKQQVLKLDKAIIKTIKEVTTLKDQLKNRFVENEDLILNIYNNILQDDYFINEIKKIVKEQKLFAENSVDICFSKCINEIDESNNDYAKQRIYDLNDLKMRLIKNIIGGDEPLLDKITHKNIVAVKEITPTVAAVLAKKRVMGILSQEGGAYFSHSAIILRGLGIPLVNGIDFANLAGLEAAQAIIDGQEGRLIINPKSTEVDIYKNLLKNNLINKKNLFRTRKAITKTQDGQIIKIFANVGSAQECIEANSQNMYGVGLVRTEILFAANRKIPDEREQFLTYLKLVKRMRNKPIVFRTLDLGGDKVFGFTPEKLSCGDAASRGIRYSLLYRDGFKAQIKSILQAAKYGDVSISFPMVNNTDELKEVKFLIKESLSELDGINDNINKELKVGAFIETSQAIENIDSILEEVSFINIGTNDLFQETMGINRLDSNKSGREYLKPEFLKLLKMCIVKAKNKNKPAIICGEMASDPLAVLVLIGMGVFELSIPPIKSVEIKAIISKINLLEAKKLFDRVIESSSAKEVKDKIFQWTRETGCEINV